MTVSHVRGSDTGHFIEHIFPQLACQYARKQKQKKKQDAVQSIYHVVVRASLSCFVTFTTDNFHLRLAYDRLTLTFTVVNGQ